MPSTQIFDFGPNSSANAAGQFGAGFSNRLLKNREQRKEDDFLENVLSKKRAGATDEDVLQNILSSRGLPLEKKVSALTAINEATEQARKNTLQKKLFGDGKTQQPGSAIPGSVSQPQTEQPFFERDPSSWSDNELAQLNAVDSKLGRTAIDLKKNSRKQFESNRDFEYKRAGKILEKTDEQRESVGIKRQALQTIRNAIESGNVGPWSGDYLADTLGVEAFRSLEGAALKTATKEFLLGNLSRAGSRPNQWIEQQIGDMLVKIGRPKGANLATTTMLESEIALQDKRIQVTDQLEKAYRDSLGYVPGSIGSEIDKAMKPFEDNQRDLLAYDLRRVYEQENGLKLKKVPQGTPLTIEMANYLEQKFKTEAEAVKKAKELGYTIPKSDIYNRYLSE